MIFHSINLHDNSTQSVSVGDNEYLENMFISSDYAFLFDNTELLMQIVDISSSSKFTLRGTYKYKSKHLYSLQVVGSHAYIAGGESGIEVFNIFDFTFVNHVDIPAFSIDGNGGYLYVKDNISFASCFQISVLKIKENGGLVLVNTVKVPEHTDYCYKDGVIYYLKN